MPSDSAASMTVGEALNLAVRLHGAGDRDQAERIYRAVLDTVPDLADAWNLLGALRNEQGAAPAALKIAKRALALDPACAAYCFNAANAARKAGELAGAVAGYRRAQQLDPTYLRPWAPLMEMLASAHDDPTLRDIVADTYDLLGALRNEQGAAPAALKIAKRALALDPACAAYCFNAANAARKAGELAGAVAGYLRARRLNPAYVRALAPLAEMLEVSCDAPTLRYAVIDRPDRADPWRLLADEYAGRDDGTRAQAAAKWADIVERGSPRPWRLRPIEPVASSPTLRILTPRAQIEMETTEAKPLFIRYDRPAHFIARLEDALIMPTNLAAATADGGLMLYGMAPYSRPSIGLLDGFGGWVGSERLLVADPPDPALIEEEAILLGGDGNFAHCVLDWLSRLMVLEKAQAEQPELAELPLLVSDRLPRGVIALLHRLGYGERLRPFIAARGLRLKRGWAPSLAHEFQLIDPEYVAWLRGRLGLTGKTAGADGERLFLARRQTGHRRLLNEDAVRALLQARGFTPFYAEDWTLEEQISRLGAARALAVTSGAGMAAVMFAPQGCGVVELTNQQMDLVQYAIVCAFLRQPYRQVVGASAENTGNLNFDADFTIDPAALEDALSFII
jgi:capsular polysaccharide biosynthesis protein/tetratricopeptide (TPR) repeat protein